MVSSNVSYFGTSNLHMTDKFVVKDQLDLTLKLHGYGKTFISTIRSGTLIFFREYTITAQATYIILFFFTLTITSNYKSRVPCIEFHLI